MTTPSPSKRGRPPGAATSVELLEKAQALREHLERPADPTRPQWGSAYELLGKRLAEQLPNPRRLGAWWRRERVQLSLVEIETCWRWLLPQ